MILVIDDDYSVTASLGLLLKQAGQAQVSAASPAEALRELRRPEVRLVLQDMNFSRRTTGEEGLELLRAIRAARPDVPVILITAWGSIGLAVEGMKAGAADFITKPWKNEQVLHSVRTILGLAASGRGEERPLPTRDALDERYDFQGILGRDPRLREVLELIGRVSGTEASILITGESGTGKEALAEAVHRNSPRSGRPLIKVNLGGIPAGLFESEMFGHVRGAFTDAHRDREGRFGLARGGTIFLDEIGELDPACQVKLLRVLQDRTYEVVGDSRARTVDVRIVSATNRDLTAAMATGQFREDLFYRLNLITVRMPTLAERRSDIPLLAGHFLAQAAVAYGRGDLTLTDAALQWLSGRPWPGNIRQLRHLIERSVLLASQNRLDVRELERTLGDATPRDDQDSLPAVGAMTMDEIEKAMILKSLAHHAGNISRVADSLGLSRPALYRRLDKYGIPT